MSNLRITELDFDDIKRNLKTYLNSQEEFSDYDFEGSGLAVLLDILAYNTHYNAYLANMLANEMFLDSAVKRESAVSLAKHLQYTPRSRVGATAKINLTYQAPAVNPPASLILDRYSVFTTTIEGVSYQFSNLEPVTALLSGQSYTFDDLTIKEGTPVTNIYTVTDTGPSIKYQLLNDNADTSTIRVFVQNSSTNSTTTYFTRAIDDAYTINATQISGQDKVFFLEQNAFGQYEIFFGDGKIGAALRPGNLIFIQYLVTNGTAGNVSNTIGAGQIFAGPRVNNISPTITTTESSNGGKEAETIEEIKFNAPRAYAAQNRLVTIEDYKSIIRREVPNIRALSVWGGEDNDPPQYGKVFICILPTSGNVLTEQLKRRIKQDVLGSRRVLSIVPEIVNPEFFYVNLNAEVKYDANKTVLTADQIRALIETKIRNYFDTSLNTFGEDFILSKLGTIIDNSDNSIIGNQTSIKQQVRFIPSLNIANSNRFILNNTLQQGTLASTRFVYNRNGVLVQAALKDVPGAATVYKTGSYRRSGSIITCTFTTAHTLTVGEEITLDFTGAAQPGTYTVYKVINAFTFAVLSEQTGSTSGAVYVTSKPRGSLQLYNPATQETILNNVGFVSYLESIIQLNNLFVVGFPTGISDIKITTSLVEGSRDIVVKRNQIIRLDDSSAKPAVNQLAGLTITVVPQV